MTDEEWERWIEAFRQHPAETVRVAQIMGRPRNRGRLAWYHGWPEQGRPPIAEILAADAIDARAKRAAIDEKEREQTPAKHLVEHGPDMVMQQMLDRDKRRQLAAADSAKTRSEEGVMIATSRRNGIALAAVTAQLIRMANQLMPKIAQQMQSENVSVKDAVTMVQKIAVITRLGTEASKMALAMERVSMGEPLSDEINANGRLDPEQAAEWVLMGMRAVERFKQRRGGLDEDEGGSAAADPAALTAPGPGESPDDAGAGADAGLASVGRPELPN